MFWPNHDSYWPHHASCLPHHAVLRVKSVMTLFQNSSKLFKKILKLIFGTIRVGWMFHIKFGEFQILGYHLDNLTKSFFISEIRIKAMQW